MAAELYKVIFSYDTDKDDELALKEGETIRITSKDSPDWWLAQRLDDSKKSGLVPSNFIEKIPSEGMTLAIVIQDYSAQAPEELSLQKNRIVTVLDRNVAEGWWKGDLNGKIGVFPANHVEFVDEGVHPGDNDSKSKKDAFKLASYGVKQGGIGSILAGGFNLKRTGTSSNRASLNEKPASNGPSNESHAPSIPTKPHPSLIKPTTSSNTPASAKLNINTTPESAKRNGERAMVLHDYKPENVDEIRLMRGEYVTVIDHMENDGWWKGISESGATGIFPSNFVQILEDEKPPQRPARARPATVKTEPSSNNTPSAAESTSMARPPPVPAATRPTSLLSNRESHSSTSSVGSPPPPRPITTPPRPLTTPPVPTRRTNSIMSPPSNHSDTPGSHGHKRIPSIPLTSPDLPPMSPVHERPTRPIPRPTSTTSTDSAATVPIVPSRANRSMSPENNVPMNNMAKPPKINFGSKSTSAPVVAPVRSPSTSRPCSINDTLDRSESLPPPPKRTMPPLPETPSPAVSTERVKPPHPTSALPSTPPSNDQADTEDELDAKIRRLIRSETNKIRKEFETRLEDERIERLRLQVELEELRASLNQ
ncbi:SH3 domain-containing protein [Mucor lusitanicus]